MYALSTVRGSCHPRRHDSGRPLALRSGFDAHHDHLIDVETGTSRVRRRRARILQNGLRKARFRSRHRMSFTASPSNATLRPRGSRTSGRHSPPPAPLLFAIVGPITFHTPLGRRGGRRPSGASALIVERERRSLEIRSSRPPLLIINTSAARHSVLGGSIGRRSFRRTILVTADHWPRPECDSLVTARSEGSKDSGRHRRAADAPAPHLFRKADGPGTNAPFRSRCSRRDYDRIRSKFGRSLLAMAICARTRLARLDGKDTVRVPVRGRCR